MVTWLLGARGHPDDLKGEEIATTPARIRLCRALVVTITLMAVSCAVATAREGPVSASTSPHRDAEASKRDGGHVDRFGDPLPPDAIARLGTVRWRQDLFVREVGFSPDGKSLATLDWDGAFRLWDVENGRLTRHVPGSHLAFAFSPDGKTIALDHIDISLLDAATGKELGVLKGHQGSVLSMAISADGKLLASSSFDGTTRLWKLSTLSEIGRLPGMQNAIVRVAFSPDSRRLASTGPDSAVLLFDPLTQKQTRRFEGHQGVVNAVAFAPDGKAIVSGGADRTIRLWEAESGRLLWSTSPQKSGVGCVAFSPDGAVIAATGDELVRLWDRRTGRELRNWSGHVGGVVAMAFSPDGKVLASGAAYDSVVHLWDVAGGREVFPPFGHRSRVVFVAFSTDGQRLFSCGTDRRSCEWDVASQTPTWSYGGRSLPAALGSVRITQDRRIIATSHYDGKEGIQVWDGNTGKKIRGFGADDKRIAALAVSPDKKYVAMCGWDPPIRIWDLATGIERTPLKGHSAGCRTLEFSPDGKTLASGSSDTTIRFWDVASGTELQRLENGTGHGGGTPYTLAFSPDGKQLAVSTAGHRCRLWNIATGEDAVPLLGAEKPTRALAFSADGRYLAAGGDDADPNSAIYIWETASGQLARLLTGHGSGTNALAFASDMRRLASGHGDSQILVWDLAGNPDGSGNPARAPTSEQLDRLWADLQGNAERAFKARCALAASPAATVSFLKAHLKPVERMDRRRVESLVRQLESSSFAERERASKALSADVDSAEGALRQRVAAGVSPETRARIVRIFDESGAAMRLRAVRSVAILEAIGTADAREVLQRLASGLQGAKQTEEAAKAWQRLSEARR